MNEIKPYKNETLKEFIERNKNIDEKTLKEIYYNNLKNKLYDKNTDIRK